MRKGILSILLGGALLFSPLSLTISEAGQGGAAPGWIHSSWQMLNQQQELPTDVQKPDYGQGRETTSNELTKAIVNGNLVYVRSGPGTNYSIVTSYQAGHVVEVVKSQNQWSQIRLPNGSYGWMAEWLLQFPQEKSKSEDSKDFKVENPTNPTYVDSEDITDKSIKSWLVTTEFTTNIRSGPDDRNYGVVRTVSKGQVFELGQVQNGWYQVLEQGQVVGWIASWLVSVKPITAPEAIVDDRRAVGEVSRGSQIISSERVVINEGTGVAGKTIVIDPGHGNLNPRWGVIDPGAIGQLGTQEKDIALDISLRLEKHLKARGAHVIMTHRGDGEIRVENELYYRAEVANSANADLFISVHNNAHFNRETGGISTFYYASGVQQGERGLRSRVASMIQQELVAELDRRNIGTREANFVVLRETKMPSVLVEILFISNLEEEQMLRQENIRERSALAMAKAIQRHFEQP
ncbi:N-acetylmuramoyl-L-alanine amidase [Heliorestis acidaminivorans]|nr:N-acetylmuramoyl-L-alanine amidase [Heliorestis acidaminivorans]